MYLWLILVIDEDGAADDDNEEGIVGDDDGGDKDTVGIENIRKNIQIVEEYRKKINTVIDTHHLQKKYKEQKNKKYGKKVYI